MYQYDAFISYSHVDGVVARLVHRGLHQIARRPGQLRALSVFRDSTELNAGPDLWGNVARAMNGSRYFVLVLSPAAATSGWVCREVDYWLADRSIDDLLLVLADGRLAWDEERRCFDAETSTAAVPRLTEPGIFNSEPLYIDLRQPVISSHPHSMLLRERLTELAAPIHGKSKSELFNEDVRELRKFRALRRTAIASLILLLIATSIAAGVAVKQRRNALDSRDDALRQRNQAQALALVSGSTATGSENAALSLALAGEASRALPESVMTQSSLLEARLRFNEAPVIPRLARITSASDNGGRTPLALSPDGRLVAAPVGVDWGVGVWDTRNGAEVAGFRSPSRSLVEALDFTPDGGALWIGTTKGLSVVDLDGGSRVRLSTRETTSIDFAFARPLVAICDSSGIRVHSTRHGFRTVATLLDRRRPAVNIDEAEIGRVAFSRDGRRLSATFGLGRVVSARLHGSSLKGVIERHVPDADGVVLGTHDESMYVVAQDSVIGFSYGTRDRRIRSDDGGWWGNVAISGDGKVIVADNYDRLSIWGTESGSSLGNLQGDGTEFEGLAIAADAGVMATLSSTGIRVWDLASNFRGTVARTGGADRTVSVDQVQAFAFLADGNTIAAASSRGVQFLDSAGERKVGFTMGRQAPLSQEKLQEIRSLDDTPGNPALDVSAITAGRNLFATLHQDNTDRDTISTWDPRTQRLLTRGFPETDYEQIGVAPEGPTLATIERRGAVRVWDGATAQLQRTLRNPDGASPSRLAFSPDSGFLAISYDNGLVRIWNLRDGQVRRSIASGSQGQPVLAWSPDGTRVAVGGFDGRVRLFDTATGRQAGSFLTSKAIVQDIAFRPDGRWLLVGGLTNLTFWDVDNRRLLGSTPVSDVSQVAFSPVGDDVAASGEGRLTLWRDLWSPGDLCSAIAPFVTSDMIKPYLPPGWHSMCRYRTATGRTGP